MTYYHEIEDAKNDLEAKRREYLTRWGWESTCHTPGSYWMWRRDFADYDARFDEWNAKHPDKKHEPHGVMLVPEDLAISMTVRCLDEQKELDEGEED